MVSSGLEPDEWCNGRAAGGFVSLAATGGSPRSGGSTSRRVGRSGAGGKPCILLARLCRLVVEFRRGSKLGTGGGAALGREPGRGGNAEFCRLTPELGIGGRARGGSPNSGGGGRYGGGSILPVEEAKLPRRSPADCSSDVTEDLEGGKAGGSPKPPSIYREDGIEGCGGLILAGGEVA